MKARREPLEIEVVYADDAVDAEAFLRAYLAAILREAQRDGIEEDGQPLEGPTNETTDDTPDGSRVGLTS